MCGLTFELSGRQRQDARPGLVKMYRVPPARAWWPAVGAPLERRVRRHVALQYERLLSVAVLVPLGFTVPEIDECTGRTLFRDHQAIGLQFDALSLIVTVASTTVLDMPDIHPGEVVSTVAELSAGSNDMGCLSTQNEGDSFLLRLAVLHQDCKVLFPITVKVSAPDEWVQAGRDL